MQLEKFVFGFLKSLLISGGVLLFLWVLVGSLMSSTAFMILGPFIMGPMMIGFWLIIVPITLFLTFATTDRSGTEILGALAVYPVLVAVFFGVRAMEEKRVQNDIEIARAALDPKYLQRKIDNPIGNIKTLALFGNDICSEDICAIALADGLAERVAILGRPPKTADNHNDDGPLKSETLWAVRSYRIAQGEPCLSLDSRHQVYRLQRVGLFGICIEQSNQQFALEDAILILDDDTGYVNRPNGLKGGDVSAAYEIKGRVTREIARWEAGALNWHGPREGARFKTIDFLRALTSSSPDSVQEAATLTLPQRIDAAYAGIGKTRIDLGAVVEYLRSAPEQNHRQAELDDKRVGRLRDLAEKGCPIKSNKVAPLSAVPPPTITTREASKNSDYVEECLRSYKRFVDWYFDAATALKF
ncbi:hypothetical protein FJ936_14970 [Mesorhizobium sp. B2-4-13]|uniref:hypothetical protein n=1 Tax=Mesorhizobium sp. B2-4-13 TaxID=2589936 RepID=UPI00114E1BC5|nr:hypothetical protein [Mesorhizobium sp. B2-4-13]TPK85159.1 hypothetical protein FJ936_14970 [Mesorhizobium sp. B2-4-13]